MSEIGPVKKFWYTPTGIEFDPGLTIEEWAAIGEGLLELHYMTPIRLGIWLCEGEQKFGETYAQAVEITHLSVDTLAHYKSTMGRVPPEVRQSGLTLSHYREVVKLPIKDQGRFLKEAFDQKLSVRKLAELVSGKPIVERRCCHQCGRVGVPLITICEDCKPNQGEKP